MVRVAMGGIVHETNTFATTALGLTTREQFDPQLAGSGFIPDKVRGAQTCIGGLVDAAEDLGFEVVPLLFGVHEPSGTVSKAGYESMRDELLADLKAVLPVDVVALDVHGAGVAEGCEDLELDLGKAVRAVVGPSVPIVSTWDLHGNISPENGSVFDFMCCYQTYPHIDNYDRGQEAMRLVPALLAGLQTVIHVEPVPTLLSVACCSTHPGFPAAEMNEVCAALEAKHPGVIDCTVFHGFPYSDISITATTVVVTTDNDRPLAASVGREVGRWIWSNKHRFSVDGGDTPILSAEEAVSQGLANPKLVVINETADNCGAGAPGDATHLLRAFLTAAAAQPDKKLVFGFMFDPAVAELAHRVGVGSALPAGMQLGGKLDPALAGAPIECRTAVVTSLSDGVFTLSGPLGTGEQQDLGPAALLRVDGLVDVIVVSRRSQTFDEEVFKLHQLNVRDYDLVGLKSSTHFRGGFAPIVEEEGGLILTADEPGLSTNRLEVFEALRTVPAALGPMWPVDDAAEYRAEQLAEELVAARL